MAVLSFAKPKGFRRSIARRGSAAHPWGDAVQVIIRTTPDTGGGLDTRAAALLPDPPARAASWTADAALL
ncbi:MAG TPA: hypothetical protein VN702_06280 [Acetobacteraceae bacterium]|nr:hypothetical protein [Acetobacteraceae bacterium]